MFFGIFFYLKKRFWAALLMYPLALMSKETTVIMPGLLVLVEAYKSGNFKTIVKQLWPYFAIAAIYVGLRATNINFLDTFNLYNEENVFTSSLWVRLLTFFRILTVYFGLLFWPFDLHMERSVEIVTSFGEWDVVLGAIVFATLLVLAFARFKKWPLVSFGILWFFISLAPTSNLAVPINGLLYEHWMYVPLVGIFTAVIWVVWKIGQKLNRQRLISLGLAGLVVFYGALATMRNRDWVDPVRFYQKTITYTPDSYRLWNNLGMELADRRRLKEAESAYLSAVALDPKALVAYHNLGNAYKALGEIDLAIGNFEHAIRLNPGFIYSYNALINIYREQGNEQKAQEVLERYLDQE